jgi:hypothetical protein
MKLFLLKRNRYQFPFLGLARMTSLYIAVLASASNGMGFDRVYVWEDFFP